MKARAACAIVLTLFLAGSAYAQRQDLAVGDQAPGLDIEEWVRGEETSIAEGNVYLVEFWATWCIPCRKTIPHLTELQERYGFDGLTVIGISTEDTDVVERFVRSQGGKMDYTVAIDRRSSTERAWLKAAGAKGIPFAFLVDKKGRLQFVGNPLAEQEKLDRIIPLVLDGRYDAKLYARMEPMISAAERARKVHNWRMFEKHLNDVISEDPHVFAMYSLDMFDAKIIDQKDPAAAYKYAGELAVKYANDPTLLARLAEKIAADPKIPSDQRDMTLAMQLAKAAAEATHPEDPDRYAIEALILYHAGKLDDAVRLQRQAYFVARPYEKQKYKRVLDSYQQAKQRGANARFGG